MIISVNHFYHELHFFQPSPSKFKLPNVRFNSYLSFVEISFNKFIAKTSNNNSNNAFEVYIYTKN